MNICFYPRIAGRLLLNLARRLQQDVLDWIFALKRSWLNCYRGDQTQNQQNGPSGPPKDEKVNITNNNSCDINKNKPVPVIEKKYDGELKLKVK